MTCLSCRRLIIEDQFLDMESPYGQMWATNLRCPNCGHVHNSVIEQPRLAQQEKVVALTDDEPDYQNDEVYLEAESITRRMI